MNNTFKNLISKTDSVSQPTASSAPTPAVSRLEAAIMRDVEASAVAVTTAHPLAVYLALKPDGAKAKGYVSVRVTESSTELEKIYKDVTLSEPTGAMAQNMRAKVDQMMILEILAKNSPELKKLIDKAEFIATRRAEVSQLLELTDKSLEEYLS
ncbi:hypothetical protein PPUJ13061_51660 [Pseudomonas putida]|jgi:hypothetical protein|uniref:hypothetical protein n=1 Tax=Pseudomonas putida TaxID=303 RepID=UPI000E0D2A29|nr:hypothetical protein [Pseudomonas putida]WQE52743.1 hypothetical protein U0028_23140 [Pseudomonas putida]GLO05264.1 hypothetical protein PPUJ13061_51660 [Pseudomonas putida]HDS1009311.1 hypothetical protein [Pseudomonas putida]